MAAPHVAGAVAALRSVRNDLTVDQIEHALESTGVSITDPRNNLTHPRINLEAAVLSVLDRGLVGCDLALHKRALQRRFLSWLAAPRQ